MKRTSLALTSLLLAATSAPLHADWIFGIYGEVQYWQPETSGSFGTNTTLPDAGPLHEYDDSNQLRLGLALHHPIPLLPNVRIERQQLEVNSVNHSSSEQQELDLTHDTLTLYYRLLDNQLTRIHFGVSAKRFDGHMSAGSEHYAISETIPMGYLMGSVGLPFTGLSAYARGHVFAFDDNKMQDIEAALQYRLIDTALIEGNIQLGYRMLNVQLDNVGGVYSDLDFKGPFLGVQLHF